MRKIILNAAAVLGVLAIVYWATDLYDAALRDPRFFDGWILAVGMAAQLLFHMRRNLPALQIGQASTWLRTHIYTGYFVIGAFAFHTKFSLPDAPFEWVLWGLFALVAISGVVGAFLSWSIPAQLVPDAEQITFERIPALRHSLAEEVETLVTQSLQHPGSRAISEVYINTLSSFFGRARNVPAHLRGSQRPLQAMCVEIDDLERYLEPPGKDTLRQIKDRVVAKDRLDFHYAHLGLLQAWLFVHIPATYCLVALTLIHILVVYAFSSGVP